MKRSPLLAVCLLVAAPLAAQQPAAQPDTTRPGMTGPGMMQGPMMPGMMQQMMQMQSMMQEMMGPMMRGMAFAPGHLLERKAMLELTEQQVARLTSLRDAAKAAHDAAHAEVRKHLEALAQSFQSASPDTVAAKQHFQAAHAAMGTAHWTMLAAAARAKAVLTDAQRGRVNGWVDAMEMRMHEGMPMSGRQPVGPPHEHRP